MNSHGNVIIRFEKVSFGYDKENPILDEADFSVREDAKITVMGQNGAGKSTIFKLLAGALKPDGGKIHVKQGATIAIATQVMPGRHRVRFLCARVPGETVRPGPPHRGRA